MLSVVSILSTDDVIPFFIISFVCVFFLFFRKQLSALFSCTVTSPITIFCRVTKKMMQQILLFINLVSGLPFWLPALVSWLLLSFYGQSHICTMTMLKAAATQSCDVIIEHLWAAEFNVRWAVEKKKKREKLPSQGLPRKQMTPCPSF